MSKIIKYHNKPCLLLSAYTNGERLLLKIISNNELKYLISTSWTTNDVESFYKADCGDKKATEKNIKEKKFNWHLVYDNGKFLYPKQIDCFLYKTYELRKILNDHNL